MSTSTVAVSAGVPGSTVSGDQVWRKPVARTAYPAAAAQLAMRTTSSEETGTAVHSGSVTTTPSQFR